jgi:hypothetical protein
MIKGSDIIRKSNSKTFTNPFIGSSKGNSANTIKKVKSNRGVDIDEVVEGTTLYLNGNDVDVYNESDIIINKAIISVNNEKVNISF